MGSDETAGQGLSPARPFPFQGVDLVERGPDAACNGLIERPSDGLEHGPGKLQTFRTKNMP
jgi:hypothetical protein